MRIPFNLLLLIVSFMMQGAMAQTTAIDSLLQCLKTGKEDTAKVNTLNALSQQSYLEGDYDHEMSYAQEALSLAKQLNWKKGIAVSLINMGNSYDNQGEFPQSLKSYETALKTYEEMGSKQGVAVCLGNIGTIYEIQGDYSFALDYYFKSLKITEEVNDKKRIAAILGNIGNIYREQGDFSKSLSYYFKSLKIGEDLGIQRPIAASLINIGTVYHEKGDSRQALDYFLKALTITEKIKETTYTAVLLGNIGAVYGDLDEEDKALEFYQKALTLNTETGRKSGISANLSNIGNVYRKRGDYKQAIDYYFKALKMDEESGRKNGVVINLSHIGAVYAAQKNYPLAKEYASRSLALAKEINSKIDMSIAYARLAKLDSATGNYQNAFLNYKMHVVYRDSLSDEEAERKSTQIAMQYEFDKKQSADSILLAEERKINGIKFADEKQQRLYLYVVLILIVLFAGFLYSRFKVTQKQKRIIEQKEKETQHQKYIIEEKHQEIKDSINYAERIQRSLLASDELLSENLSGNIGDAHTEPKNYFVFFKPKDVVSGDFYWASKLTNNNFALITADSTGHGVPGAIMSILNIACLNEAIKEGNCEPEAILNETRKKVIEVLKRDGSETGGKDGMDCSLLVFEPFTHSQKKATGVKTRVHVAAAHNPVWIVRSEDPNDPGNKQMIEIKADKMPVGKHDKDTTSFTGHTIELNSGNMIYTLTDGFPDQFGGVKGKKYMIKNLKETLLNIAHLPVSEQHQVLDNEFSTWKGSNEQVDDVTIIGIRV